MHNYFISYNLFKDSKKVASGDAVVEISKKILNKTDYNELKFNLENNCKKIFTDFNFIHLVSLTYLGWED